MAQLVKNLPAVRETWVQSPDWEDTVEEGAASHSSILAWRIPWTRKESDTTEQLSLPSFSETAVRKSIWIGDLIAASRSLSLFLKILTVMGLHSGMHVQ